jgi:four helix bundle protein
MGWTDFEEIEIWQKARIFNRRIWELIASGSFSKDFALIDQINRASGSVMDHIAEGFDAGSHAEFARFLSYSQRSCSEVKSQLARALDRNHTSNEQYLERKADVTEINRKKGSLIKHLKSKSMIDTRHKEPSTAPEVRPHFIYYVTRQ